MLHIYKERNDHFEGPRLLLTLGKVILLVEFVWLRLTIFYCNVFLMRAEKFAESNYIQACL